MPGRMFAPFYPLACIVLANGVKVSYMPIKKNLAFIITLLLILTFVNNLLYLSIWIQNRELALKRICIGEWLGENLPDNSTIAVFAAGAIPYYSGLRTIDFSGLNDVYVSHQKINPSVMNAPGHERFALEYALDQKPDSTAYYDVRNTRYEDDYEEIHINCQKGVQTQVYVKKGLVSKD